jgi:hypothetical protein
MKVLSCSLSRASFSLLLATQVFGASMPGVLSQDQQPPAALNVVIVSGDGAVNNSKQHTSRDDIVRVENQDHQPVSGALVLFAAPNDGPGGTFLDDLKSLQVTTDSRGIATAHGFRPNTISGPYQIKVTAIYGGQAAYAAIRQSNTVPANSNTAFGVSGKTLLIIGGVVAAAGTVGGIVATRGGGSGAGATISPGTATVGAPH